MFSPAMRSGFEAVLRRETSFLCTVPVAPFLTRGLCRAEILMPQVLLTTLKPLETNLVYRGDCTKVLANHIPDASIDLIYVDPPFFSNRRYELLWQNGYELRGCGGRW